MNKFIYLGNDILEKIIWETDKIETIISEKTLEKLYTKKQIMFHTISLNETRIGFSFGTIFLN